MVHQIDFDSKLHAQLFFGTVQIQTGNFFNFLIPILYGVMVQVHGVRSQLQVPPVLNNIDERLHKVGIMQLVMSANFVDVFLVRFLYAGIVLDAIQKLVNAQLGVEHDIVTLIDQAADFDRLLRFLIGDMTIHNRIFGF